MFADKAAGYGIPGITIDGTDPDQVAAAFTWAADRARAGARACAHRARVACACRGHAHHDDMLFLGNEPPIAWDYPKLSAGAYADAERCMSFWTTRDPIAAYASRLESAGVIGPSTSTRYKQEAAGARRHRKRARSSKLLAGTTEAGTACTAGDATQERVEPLEPEPASCDRPESAPAAGRPGLPFDRKGQTFLDAIALGIADALRADPRVFVYGEDVGGNYGNSFLLLRPLLEEFGDRIMNSPIAEGGVLGVCVGAALAGQRPIGEMQFNDFVASGFNQLVNNAAKIRYRWGGSVPMVVRMPWGGLRHAGPYHSQNTEAWFYRTPGLKIVVPSTPEDARALMAAAVADPDPVLFYEHIALYRDPAIKQVLPTRAARPTPARKGGASPRGRRPGDHFLRRVRARRASRRRTLAADGIDASVLDLRTLSPLDRPAVLALARHCSRVLIVHEDTRTGSIGESLAAIIQEEAFESLDAPVRIIGALDTPVPYSPPLEEYFLPSQRRSNAPLDCWSRTETRRAGQQRRGPEVMRR